MPSTKMCIRDSGNKAHRLAVALVGIFVEAYDAQNEAYEAA